MSCSDILSHAHLYRAAGTVAVSAAGGGSLRRSTMRKDRRAFSLVELIVVMVILGMLAGLVAVRTRGYLINSKQNAAKTEIANIVKALESFYATEGRYPTTDEGLEILAQDSDSFPGGLLNKVPVDPWKRPYEYVSPGSTQPYEVICLGGDGREGGDGENQDFSSESLGDA